jgi:hypothetical protein
MEIGASEGGRRFLINLLIGIEQSHIDGDSARDLLIAISKASRDGPEWHPFLPALKAVIFSDPDRYQFQGPIPSYSPAEWMTVKSMGDLLYLAESNSGLNPDELKIALGVADLGPNIGLPEAAYLRFAETLSDTDVTFTLARCFPHPQRAAELRPVPSWYSRWCYYPFAAIPRPTQAASGRLRDYLGLSYASVPLFLIRARRPIEVGQIFGHRPTVYEGFDNPFYKHRAGDERFAEDMGSTADLEHVRRKDPPQPIEGGPELVSRGLVYRSDELVCEYVGTAPELDYDVETQDFHKFLLGTGETIEEATRRVASRIGGAIT